MATTTKTFLSYHIDNCEQPEREAKPVYSMSTKSRCIFFNSHLNFSSVLSIVDAIDNRIGENLDQGSLKCFRCLIIQVEMENIYQKLSITSPQLTNRVVLFVMLSCCDSTCKKFWNTQRRQANKHHETRYITY